jgi:hypothetical protein
MNASAKLFTHETTNAAPAAERFGQRLLLVNGIVLGTIAFGAALIDLAGAILGVGPLAQFKGQPVMVGMFEAHVLALAATVMITVYHRESGVRWNLLAAAMHGLFFCANLAFWQFFVDTNAVTMGTVITAMHLVFFLLEGGTAIWRRSERRPAAILSA